MTVGPSCALAWGYSSLTCGYLGDYPTAVARAERAVRLSPLGADAFWFEHFLSQAYYLSDRYEDAVAWARMSDAHNSANTSNLRCLVASLIAVGEVDEARRIACRLLQLVPRFRLTTFRSLTPLRGEIGNVFAERLQIAGVPE
jgi:adenylate cyclase